MANEYKNSFQLYANGDPGCYKVFKEPESFVLYENNYDTLIKNRNANMDKKIDGLAGSGKKYLVAVGEAHFVTGDSIINYWGNLGYKVEAIPD